LKARKILELAHLKICCHNKNFAAILNKYMPNWTAKKLDEFIILAIN